MSNLHFSSDLSKIDFDTSRWTWPVTSCKGKNKSFERLEWMWILDRFGNFI